MGPIILILLLLLPYATVNAHSPSLAADDITTRLVGSFLKALSNNTGPCWLIVGHDYPSTLPLSIQEALRYHQATLDQPILQIQLTESESKLPEMKLLHWFSWLESPPHDLARPTCGLVLLLFLQDNLPLLLEKLARSALIRSRHDRIVYMRRDGGDVAQALMHRKNRPFLYKMGIHPQPETLQLVSECFFCNGGQPQLVTVGQYDEEKGLKMSELYGNEMFPDFTVDLSGTFLEGFFIYAYNRESVRQRQSNMHPVFPAEALWADCGDSLNFTWNVKLLSLGSGVVESQLDNGTWVGMVGEVLYDRAPFSGPTIMFDPPQSVIEYPRAIFEGYVTMITHRQRPLYSWKSIIEPYTADMWMCILASCVLATLFFWGILRVLNAFVVQPFKGSGTYPDHSFFYSMQFMFSTLVEENPNLLPTANTARMFICLWWVFSDIISMGYDTMLISFLAAPVLEEVPSNYKELVDWRPKWRWGLGAEHAVFFKMLVEDTELEYQREVNRKLERSENLMECVMRAEHEEWACMALDIYLLIGSMQLLFSDGHNPLMLAPDTSMKIIVSFVLSKHSILSPAINRKMAFLGYSGLIHKYNEDFLYTAFLQGLLHARRINRVRDMSMALKIDQMKGPMYVLVICAIGIGTVAFIAEHVHFRMQRKKKSTGP